MRSYFLLLIIGLVLGSAIAVETRDSIERYGYLPPSKSFLFSLNCGELDDNQCEEANATLHRVGKMIAAEIFMRVPIIVNLSFVEYRNRDKHGIYFKPVIAEYRHSVRILC